VQRTKARASARQVWSCRSVRSVAVEWHSGSCAGYYKPTPSLTADPTRPPTPSPTVDSTPSEGDHDAGHKVQADSKLVGCASIATQTRSLLRALIRGIIRFGVGWCCLRCRLVWRARAADIVRESFIGQCLSKVNRHLPTCGGPKQG
jgi:hypothetical protein